MHLLIVGEANSDIIYASDLAIKYGATVSIVTNITKALDHARQGKGSDLILVDSKFDIKSLKSNLSAEKINAPIIAYGIHASPKEAVQSIKDGAKEFLNLPADKEIISKILSTLSKNQKELLFASKAMQDIIAIADKIAKTDAHILISGKTGTGKEVLAHYLHNKSLRSKKPFIRVNCAAIPENLLESELFGHEKGSFTGAIGRRIGKFEESSNGTLLLDEISEMDMKLQTKLLRAIQEQEIDRIGGSRPIKVNLRIMATSNKDLDNEIRKGNFREDLFFRLNIINFQLPDLASRKDDITILTNFFIEKYCNNNNLPCKKIGQDTLEHIYNHPWPGNIRELENTIHRAVLLSQGNVIEISDLNLHQPKQSLIAEDKDNQFIMDNIGHCLNEPSAKAEILSIAINTLKSRLKSLG